MGDTLCRDKDRRLQGPGHCLDEAMKAVEAANPDILDEPLPSMQLFQPGRRGVGGEEPSGGGGQKNNKEPRGKKRKAEKAAEEAAKAKVAAEASAASEVTCATAGQELSADSAPVPASVAVA